jgi:histidinol-phosphate aminotransferase
MAPTPVTTSELTATGPSVYTWEATDEEVAARYRVPIERIARFDLNTSPTAPPLAERVIAAGRFERPISEYPPADYRRLTDAAAEAYGVSPGEILVGAGADEILDLCAKAFLPAGARAVVPSPSYAMFRVLTEQRAARVMDVPRLGVRDGYAMDVAAVRGAARDSSLVWLCSPNNPTGLAEPAGSVETLLDDLLEDAGSAGRVAPAVVLDEAYAEFAGSSLLGLRSRYPRLVVVRTASKAYALAGLRVGFAIANRSLIAEIEPYRPPGSVSVVSVTVVTEALKEPAEMHANVARLSAERERLGAALSAEGWSVESSVTNFLLVDFEAPARAAAVADHLLRRGLVPRTFGPRHPLADHLRLTVRSTEEDDRLIEAAGELAPDEDGI